MLIVTTKQTEPVINIDDVDENYCIVGIDNNDDPAIVTRIGYDHGLFRLISFNEITNGNHFDYIESDDFNIFITNILDSTFLKELHAFETYPEAIEYLYNQTR